jgi:hypothetical protein
VEVHPVPYDVTRPGDSDRPTRAAAEQHYLAALQGEPEFYMAHLNLGRLRMLQKRFAEAEQHVVRAEQDARRQNDAAMVIKSRGWLEKARTQLSRQP